MLRPTVTEIAILEGYRLKLRFDSGEIKVFDVTPFIKGDWFSELADESYFSQAKPNGYNVEWPNGQDLCPDELYFNSRPI